MRIKNIHIKEIRGAVDLKLDFGCKNAVIFGPNGSGKSAVAEAIDFLFSGSIQSLNVDGLGKSGLSKYGRHIKSKEGGNVTATVSNSKNFKVSRSFENAYLEVQEGFGDQFELIEKYASNGCHYLSRRHILKYIMATPGSRSEEIDALIETKSLDEIRLAISDYEKKTREDLEVHKNNYNSDFNNFIKSLEIEKIGDALQSINKKREILGGEAICESNNCYLDGLTFSDTQKDSDLSLILRALDRFKKQIISTVNQLRKYQTTLGEKIEDIIQRARDSNVDELKLIEEGIKLLDDSGKCPLCGHHWESKKAIFEIINDKKKGHDDLVENIDELKKLIGNMSTIIDEFHEHIGEMPKSENVKKYTGSMKEILESLHAVKIIPEISEDKLMCYKNLFNGLLNKDYSKDIEQMCQLVSEIEPLVDFRTDEKANAWKSLNEAQNLKNRMMIFEGKCEEYEKASQLAQVIKNTFEDSRKAVLNKFYEEISEKFTDLYTKLHSDEMGFIDAKLIQEKAGVNFEVGFYGCGRHPPHALHSEGHQDSMGLILFLAIIEKIDIDKICFVVLDDVLTSIDMGHRAKFCDLIKQEFSHVQFIITTHDEVWARELVDSDAVPKENKIEFLAWNIDLGPKVKTSIGGDVWQDASKKAEESLDMGAAFLRRGAEDIFSKICSEMKAKIEYNRQCRWDLGQFMDAAYVRLSNCLSAVVSEQQEEADQMIEKMKKIRSKVEGSTWYQNTILHKNDVQLCKSDLDIGIKLLKEFYELFLCKCGKKIEIHYTHENKPSMIKCKTCKDSILHLKV